MSPLQARRSGGREAAVLPIDPPCRGDRRGAARGLYRRAHAGRADRRAERLILFELAQRSCWRSSFRSSSRRSASPGGSAPRTRAPSIWPDWEFSGTLELIVWSIPALVIVFLGGIAWFGSHALDPFLPIQLEHDAGRGRGRLARLEVAVHLPEDGIASVNSSSIPVGPPIHFRLTSSRRDEQLLRAAARQPDLHDGGDDLAALPRRPIRPGTYRGLSAKFSGDGFSDMRFEVRAVSADDYAKWLADAKSSKAALDRNVYAELVKPSENVRPTYRAVEPGLFEAIVNETAPQPPPLNASAPSGQDLSAATCRGN